jgi:hypothetical protein
LGDVIHRYKNIVSNCKLATYLLPNPTVLVSGGGLFDIGVSGSDIYRTQGCGHGLPLKQLRKCNFIATPAKQSSGKFLRVCWIQKRLVASENSRMNQKLSVSLLEVYPMPISVGQHSNVRAKKSPRFEWTDASSRPEQDQPGFYLMRLRQKHLQKPNRLWSSFCNTIVT